MSLKDLGYTEELEKYRRENGLDGFEIGRVSQEHKDRYTVLTDSQELDCELIGSLRFSASNRNDLPAVGDWVAISEYDEKKGLIHAVLPRATLLERQAVGKFAEKQIIAANIDYGIIVQAVNRDFSLNRLERYLTICHDAGIQPLIVLSKIDLADKEEVSKMLLSMKDRIKKVPLLPLSNTTLVGMEGLKEQLHPGKTYCLLGSSGVGKSSLINTLMGESKLATGSISESIDRGKHITTHRELIPLVNGAILIDNPGMREIGMTDKSEGLQTTFEEIHQLAQSCKFTDCTHTNEKGCAIQAAIELGELDPSAFENYLKMEREQEHYSATIAEKRRKDKKQGKMYKQIIESKRKDL